MVSTLPHVEVKATETGCPVEHVPVQVPDVGQEHAPEVHVTLFGETLQTSFVKLFVTCREPPLITRFVLVVPEIVMSDVVAVVISAIALPDPDEYTRRIPVLAKVNVPELARVNVCPVDKAEAANEPLLPTKVAVNAGT